jgi:Type IV secretion-system coupling protein DNA-binding domain
MFGNRVRTVPPRPKSGRLLCLVVLPFLLSRSLRIWAHFADPYQALFLVRYVKDAIRVTLHLGGKKALADYLSLYDLYYHAGALYVLRYPLAADVVLVTALYLWLRHVDYKDFNQLRRGGRQISGPVLHTPKSFEKTVQGDGIKIGVAWPKLVEKIIKTPRSYIHIPREAEKEHFAVSGSPGSGKTTTLQWIVDSIKERNEREGKRTVFVYFDPHGSFTERYWTPGAWVANPFDARGFSWCPTWELDLTRRRESKAKVLSMAKSVYVGKQRENATNSSNEFFTRSSQLLYGHLVLNHQPSEAQELAYWMDHPEEEIETRVTGKLATDLDHGSMGQRNGILSSFTMPQQAFGAVPLSGWWMPDGTWRQNAPCWTAKDWCLHREADTKLHSNVQ